MPRWTCWNLIWTLCMRKCLGKVWSVASIKVIVFFDEINTIFACLLMSELLYASFSFFNILVQWSIWVLALSYTFSTIDIIHVMFHVSKLTNSHPTIGLKRIRWCTKSVPAVADSRHQRLVCTLLFLQRHRCNSICYSQWTLSVDGSLSFRWLLLFISYLFQMVDILLMFGNLFVKLRCFLFWACWLVRE